MKLKRTGLIFKVLMIVVAVYAVVSLLRIQSEINDVQGGIDELNVQIDRQKRTVSKLEEAVDDENSDEVVSESARKDLGLVKDGEIIFKDITN